jgi:RNA polymerase sigma-70 factor, ECF subfamily
LSAVDQLTLQAQAARLGDAAALESFIRASYDHVWRFCAALAGTAAADDLTQETYARCVPSLRRFRGDASALTWLLSIARHVCASELRSRGKTRMTTTGDHPEDSAWLAVPDAAEEVVVADLFARLDPDRRAAFVLTQVLGLPYADAAVVCGCPVGTIRSRVARAREDLIAMLAAGETTPPGRRQAGAGFCS